MYEANLSPVSNRADWHQPFEIINDDTNQPITDFSGVTVTLEVRQHGCHWADLTADTTNGKIVDLGNGVLEMRIPRSEMTRLCPGTYEIGVTIERDDFTSQYLIGILPIVDGIVHR